MKQLCIYLITVLFLFSCKRNRKEHVQHSISKDTSGMETIDIPVEAPIIWKDTADKSIFFTLPGATNWPNKEFLEIPEEEFNNRLAINPVPGKIDSSQVGFSDSTFTIQTSKAKFTFYHSKRSKFVDIENESVNYLGYIEGINMYVLTKWLEGEIYMGEMLLIDSVSNYLYKAMSASDGATEFPLISVNGEFMLFYSNAYHYSGLIVAKREETDGKTHYVQLMSAYINGLIEEIKWTEDDFLFVKINDARKENNYQDDISYYKTMAPFGKIEWKVP